MNDLELVETRLRIFRVLLDKKIEQYHQVTLYGDLDKRHEIHRQLFDLRRAIDRLEYVRKKLGGGNNGETD